MNLSILASKLFYLLPAGLDNTTLHLESSEISLSSLFCEEQLFAPLFVTQVACLYFAKEKSNMFKFNVIGNSNAPSGLELIDFRYSMLNKQQKETLFDSVAEALWDFEQVILGKDLSNNAMGRNVERALGKMRSLTNHLSEDSIEKADLTKIMSNMFDGYANDKYRNLGFNFSMAMAINSEESVYDLFDVEINNLFDESEDSSEDKTVEPEPANPSDIFKFADKPVKALIDRIGLYAKALEQNVDDTILIAAIGACKPARDAMKAALGLTEAQHLQFPESVHNIYETLSSKVNLRSWEENGLQTDWFNFHQVPATRKIFFEDSLFLFSWLFSKNEQVVSYSVPHIEHLVDEAKKLNDNSLIAEFVRLNSISAGKRARKIRAIENQIDAQVVGQEEARSAVVNTVRKILTPGSTTCGPVFLYGASGVGKTFLATSLFKATSNEGLLYDIQIINMEAYGQERSESQLIGSCSMYSNAIIGELTMPMEFNPNQIFVFDEIEKAHDSVLRSLLTILSARTCMDAATRRYVDFSQAIFIFTSNAGQGAMQKGSQHDLPLDHTAALSESFSPEFISRMKLGEIVCCKPLSTDNLIEYIDNIISPDLQKHYECTEDLNRGIALLSEGLSPRSISGTKAKIAALVSKEIENALIEHDLDDVDNISLKFSFTPGQHMDISVQDFIAQYHYKTWQVDVTASHQILGDGIEITLSCKEPRAGITPEHASLTFMQISLSSDVRFDDVFGHEQVKEQLQNAIHNIKQRKPQDGIMFYGEPGTGKTMMARAVAGEAGVTFISANAPDLTSGDTEANIKKLFEAARRYAPAIIFIDEFDAVAGKRETGSTGMRLIVSSFLTMLDGFSDSNLGLLTIVASNHPDAIDTAILRPGRISHHLHLAAPGDDGIEKLVGRYPFAENIDAQTLTLARRLLSGRNIVKTQQLFECIAKQEHIDDKTVRMAIIEEVLGSIKELSANNARELIAYHEAGHALASHLLTDNCIFLLDINGRSKHEGICLTVDESKGEKLTNRLDIENKVKVLLAGRAAEWLYTGHDNLVSIGAGQDLSQATKMLKHAILKHGMSHTGALAVASEFNQSEQEVFAEVNEWMNLLYSQTKALLKNNLKDLTVLATALSKNRTLFVEDIEKLLPKSQKAPQQMPLLQCSNFILN